MRKNAIAVGATAILSRSRLRPRLRVWVRAEAWAAWVWACGKGSRQAFRAKDIETHCAGIRQGPGQRACLEGSKEPVGELPSRARVTGPDRGRGTGPVATFA